VTPRIAHVESRHIHGPPPGARTWRRAALLAAGPVAYAILWLLAPADMPGTAAHVLGVAGWMATWWLTEPVPLGATSLLPLVLFPLLGVSTTGAAAAPYANELVFLFLAGFLLAVTMQQWNAHARLAYGLISFIGTEGRRIVLGVMVATAFLSMWISNTATAAMMLPIVLAIGALFPDGAEGRNMRTSLLLGMAFAASIGGMATLIGTPPNLIFAGAVRQLLGVEIGFAQFMAIGLPVTLIFLPAAWAALVFLIYPASISLGGEAARLIANRRGALGRLAGGERTTLIVFAGVAIAWLMRERKDFGEFALPGLTDLLPGLTDASIGLAGALLLFVLNGRAADGSRRPLLTWAEAKRIPWEVLLLFGGGLSLAMAMEASGLAAWLGARMGGLGGLHPLLILAGVAAFAIALSEIASNTAIAAMAMPIVASLAIAIGQPPVALMLVAALAASGGMALPVATPPNTIIFASGQVTVQQLAKAGLVMDGICILLVVGAVALLYPLVIG
jgi:solute carrier family 13 (sodium-dependent dicarboxylate transporter), member 2/3/5